MVLYRILIETEADDPQAIKEDLAMALERAKPARIVEISEVYRQEEMGRSGADWLRELYLKQKRLVENRQPGAAIMNGR